MTEIINKGNKIIMKFHTATKKKKAVFTEKDYPIEGNLVGFHIIVNTNRMGQIAQYSPIEAGVDFSQWYHRPATPENVYSLIQTVADLSEERRVKTEQERQHRVTLAMEAATQKKPVKKTDKKK